jgi:hypothetical protein
VLHVGQDAILCYARQFRVIPLGCKMGWATMGKYCKAYAIKKLREFSDWIEKTENARKEKGADGVCVRSARTSRGKGLRPGATLDAVN